MVHQSGHPLDGSLRPLEGVSLLIYPFCKGTGFLSFLDDEFSNCTYFLKIPKIPLFGHTWQSFGHYNFAIFSTMIYNFESKKWSQY